MTAPARAEQQPRQAPVELRCKGCGAWICSGPGGTPWLRGRCGNRSVLGQPGRKCAFYGQTQTVRFA
jgi:hypothetical protein